MRSSPCLFVFDGFADWEAAYAIAELRRSGGHQVRILGLTGEPVVSMGGLTIIPDEGLAEADPELIRILILPGGDWWLTAEPDPGLTTLIGQLLRGRTPVAAICGATVGLARMGFLRGRPHTGNDRAELAKLAPNYGGEEQYVEAPVVRDRGLITASGLAAVPFAREIFEELGVFTPEEREEWEQLFGGRQG